MLFLRDVAGLLHRPGATLARMDGRRWTAHGLLGVGISVTLPALAAELAALGPFTPPPGAIAAPTEIHLLSDTFFRWLYAERFLLPLVDLLAGAALWLTGVGLIHVVARRLGGRGSLAGYLGLCGSIAMVGALAVPALLLEAGLRAAGHADAADAVTPLGAALGLAVFTWQNVLLVIAAARHYRLPLERAVTAVVGPAAAIAVLLIAGVITATLLAVMALGPTG